MWIGENLLSSETVKNPRVESLAGVSFVPSPSDLPACPGRRGPDHVVHRGLQASRAPRGLSWGTGRRQRRKPENASLQRSVELTDLTVKGRSWWPLGQPPPLSPGTQCSQWPPTAGPRCCAAPRVFLNLPRLSEGFLSTFLQLPLWRAIHFRLMEGQSYSSDHPVFI